MQLIGRTSTKETQTRFAIEGEKTDERLIHEVLEVVGGKFQAESYPCGQIRVS